MPTRPKTHILVRTYEHARAREAKHGVELTPKGFLDLIDPDGKRSESSAKRYMRKLATGERSGAKLVKSAHKDSGRTVNVRFRAGTYTDSTGQVFEDIRSANVTIPERMSRLDFWKGDRLRKAVDAYLQNSYTRRVEQNKAGGEQYEAISRLDKRAPITEIRRIRGTRFPTQILR